MNPDYSYRLILMEMGPRGDLQRKSNITVGYCLLLIGRGADCQHFKPGLVL